MGAGVAANPHCPVPSAEPGLGWASSPGFRVARGAEAPRGPMGSLVRRASLPSELPVPAGSLSGSIAAPASGSRRDLRRHGIAAGASDPFKSPSVRWHRCQPHPVSCSGSSPGIAARLGSLRVAARTSLPVQVPAAANRSLRLVCRRFAAPSARRRPVPPGSAGKWERLRLAPLPHASSLIALPLPRSLITPLRASWLRAAAAAARSFLRSGALAPRFRPLPATR